MSVRNLLDLSGKIALVTGGSRGIGLQMAAGLGEMGARVALTARKQDELDAARAQLEAGGIECLTVAGDLSDAASIASAVDAVLGAWKQIDVVVNNAGTNWAAPAEDSTSRRSQVFSAIPPSGRCTRSRTTRARARSSR